MGWVRSSYKKTTVARGSRPSRQPSEVVANEDRKAPGEAHPTFWNCIRRPSRTSMRFSMLRAKATWHLSEGCAVTELQDSRLWRDGKTSSVAARVMLNHSLTVFQGITR